MHEGNVCLELGLDLGLELELELVLGLRQYVSWTRKGYELSNFVDAAAATYLSYAIYPHRGAMSMIERGMARERIRNKSLVIR